MILVLIFIGLCRLASAQDRYTVFVVDDTGSMTEEIGAVKIWLENCLNGSYPHCEADQYIMTTFNDPYIGNLTGPTSDISEVLEAVRDLYADGGFDCPELRYEGMQLALEAVPSKLPVVELRGREETNCKVFLFTDATAKDAYLRFEVEKMFTDKGCSLFPLLTGCCGTCPDACEAVSEEYCINHVIDHGRVEEKEVDEPKRKKRSTPPELVEKDDALYLYRLAEKTGGTIYIVESPSTSEQMLDFLEEEVSFGFCPSGEIAGPLPDGFKCEADCTEAGMCWDKSVKKCYCAKSECSNEAPSETKCVAPKLPTTTIPSTTSTTTIPSTTSTTTIPSTTSTTTTRATSTTPTTIMSTRAQAPKIKKKKANCRKDVPYEYVSNAKDCQRFHVCVFGKKYQFICPAGQVFDGKVCSNPENVEAPCGTLN